jgi:hypothetical protein
MTIENEKAAESHVTGMSRGPKYPDITVTLIGRDGNAFAILGAINKAMKAHGVRPSERSAFYNEATSGDYDHLLCTAMEYVNVE